MHVFGIGLFGLIALFWVTYGLRVAYGATRLPWVRDFLPAPDANCPRISLLFAARDEEEKLPAALATLMEIDYPELEPRVYELEGVVSRKKQLLPYLTHCLEKLK